MAFLKRKHAEDFDEACDEMPHGHETCDEEPQAPDQFLSIGGSTTD